MKQLLIPGFYSSLMQSMSWAPTLPILLQSIYTMQLRNLGRPSLWLQALLTQLTLPLFLTMTPMSSVSILLKSFYSACSSLSGLDAYANGGELFSLDMQLLKAANSTPIPWVDVQKLAFNTAGYQPVMALAQNHIHFFGTPGTPDGSAIIFVIHCTLFELWVRRLLIRCFSLLPSACSTIVWELSWYSRPSHFLLPGFRCPGKYCFHPRWWLSNFRDQRGGTERILCHVTSTDSFLFRQTLLKLYQDLPPKILWLLISPLQLHLCNCHRKELPVSFHSTPTGLTPMPSGMWSAYYRQQHLPHLRVRLVAPLPVPVVRHPKPQQELPKAQRLQVALRVTAAALPFKRRPLVGFLLQYSSRSQCCLCEAWGPK